MSMGTSTLRIILRGEVSGLEGALTRAVMSLTNFRDAVKKVSDAHPGLISALTAASAYYSALGVAVGKAVNATRDFEYQMYRIKSLFVALESSTEDATKAYEEMHDAALRIGKTTIFSATEAADAMGKLIEAGLTVNEVMSSVDKVLKFAAISSISLERASIIAVQVMRAFGLEAEQLDKALGVMTIAALESTGRISDMALSIGYVAGVAGELGLTLEETAMWTGVLTNVLTTTTGTFMQAGKAGRYLRTLLMELSEPKTARRLEAVGIQVWDESGDKMRDLTGIFMDFRDLAGKMSKRELFWFADQLGLSQVAASALYYAMRAGEEVIGRFRKELQDVSDWQEIYAERSMSLNWQLERLKNVTDVLWISMGEGLVPSLKDLVDSITNLLDQGDSVEGFLKGFGEGIAEYTINPLAEAIKFIGRFTNKLDGLGVDVEDFGKKLGNLSIILPTLMLIAKFLHPGLAIALGLLSAAWESNFLGMRDALEPLVEEISKTLPDALAMFLASFTTTDWGAVVRKWIHGIEINIKKGLLTIAQAFLPLTKALATILPISAEPLEKYIESLKRDIGWGKFAPPDWVPNEIQEYINRYADWTNTANRSSSEWSNTTRETAVDITHSYDLMGSGLVDLNKISNNTTANMNKNLNNWKANLNAVLDVYSEAKKGVESTGFLGESLLEQIQRSARDFLQSIGAFQTFEFNPPTGGNEGALGATGENTIVNTDKLVNIENLNLTGFEDVDAISSYLGSQIERELRERGGGIPA